MESEEPLYVCDGAAAVTVSDAGEIVREPLPLPV